MSEEDGLLAAYYRLAGFMGVRLDSTTRVALINEACDKIRNLAAEVYQLECQAKSLVHLARERELEDLGDDDHDDEWDEFDPDFHDDDCDCESCCDEEDDP